MVLISLHSLLVVSQLENNMYYATVNSKAWFKASNPTDSSVLFRTVSRGVTLPDTMLLAHRTQKNAVEAGSIDKLSTLSVQRTYVNSDGVVKTVQWSINCRIPDDAPSGDVTGCLADLMDALTTASTLRSANTDAIVNGEIA